MNNIYFPYTLHLSTIDVNHSMAKSITSAKVIKLFIDFKIFINIKLLKWKSMLLYIVNLICNITTPVLLGLCFKTEN